MGACPRKGGDPTPAGSSWHQQQMGSRLRGSIRVSMKEDHALAAPAFAGATGGSSLRQRLQPVILVIIPDLALQNLARRGVRQFVDEDDFVGQPPFRDLVLQISEVVRLARPEERRVGKEGVSTGKSRGATTQ